MTYLVADIGGTNARVAVINKRGQVLEERHLSMGDFADMSQLLGYFMQDTGADALSIRRLVLALAGPMRPSGEVALTNLDWVVSIGQLQPLFPQARILFINDFQAAALGVLSLNPDDLLTLNPGDREMKRGDISVVLGAGTGLGTAILQYMGDGQYHTLSTEAGHADFSPADVSQMDLLKYLGARFGHVSWERVASGRGLVDLYRFYSGTMSTEITPRWVNEQATAGVDQHALDAVQTFVCALAAYAGNLALIFKPAGGLYLAGGMVVKMIHWFDADNFLSVYADKGRMSDIVKNTPVSLVNNDRAGLLGTIRYAVEASS